MGGLKATNAIDVWSRRERIQCWLGATIGVVCGFGGMIAGLVASGRL